MPQLKTNTKKLWSKLNGLAFGGGFGVRYVEPLVSIEKYPAR